MIDADELITFILGIIVLLFIVSNWKQIRLLRNAAILFAGFLIALSAWLISIVEGFWLADFFNLVEHFLYMSSAVVVLFWCFRLENEEREEQ